MSSESPKRRINEGDEDSSKDEQRRRNAERKRIEEASKQELEKKRETSRAKAKIAMNAKNRKDSFLEKYSYHLAVGGFLVLVGLALASFVFGDHRKLNEIPVLDEAFLESYSTGTPFTLAKNDFFEGWTLQDAKLIINNGLTTRKSMQKCPADESAGLVLEPSYSAKEAMPECFEQSFPIDQKNCSSSWAIAPTDVFTDRFCMVSGNTNFKASAQQVLSCDTKANSGCKSGYIMAALDFGKQQGYVDTKCMAYEGKGPEEVECNADKMRTCSKQYIEDFCVVEGEEEIKKEIKNNGPVVGIIPVYRDFLAYKDGIYEVQEGVSRFDSGQAVKVFGWGEENGRNYWLVENYWGETWGDRGVVKIYGGQEDMYLDSFALSIRPKYVQPVSDPYHEMADDEDIPVERQYM